MPDRPVRTETRGSAPRPEDLRRTEGLVVGVRWAAAAFAVLQVTIYSAQPYPPRTQEVGYALVAVLVAGNLVLWQWNRTSTHRRETLRVAVAALGFDVAIASAFVWLYTFDPTSALFLVLFILPADAAARFHRRGAIAVWAVTVVLYTARELFGVQVFGHTLDLSSITFRMGVLFILTLIVGGMAQQLAAQRVDLESTSAELRRVNAWRTGLLGVLGHDIRSPLSTVLSTIDLIDQRYEQLDGDRVHQLLAGTRRMIRRTLSLADDLLDLARLEQDRMVLRPTWVNLAAEIRDAVDDLHSPTEVQIEVADDVAAVLDRARLRQIVTNLVANAIRHGSPPVRISASRAAKTVEIVVEDEGPGVPAQQQPALFRAFTHGQRADSVGLGLWIVSQLAQAHGGSVLYETCDGGGARFVVQLAELSTPVRTDPGEG